MKNYNAIDIVVGALAGTGVFGKLNNAFNSPEDQTDLISSVGFTIASFIAGAVVSVFCCDWTNQKRIMLTHVYDSLMHDKYASPKDEEDC